MFFEVLAFSSLEVEPSIGNCTDMRKKCLNERVKFILSETDWRIHHDFAFANALPGEPLRKSLKKGIISSVHFTVI